MLDIEGNIRVLGKCGFSNIVIRKEIYMQNLTYVFGCFQIWNS